MTIALRHILGNRRMAAITALSVALAVGVIVLMMGLMSGFQDELITSTIEKNPHILIEPKEDEQYIRLYHTLHAAVWQEPQVSAASSRLSGKAAAKYRDKVVGVSFIGVIPGDEDGLMQISEKIRSGNFDELRYRKYSAFIGYKLAEELKVRQGGEITVQRGNRSMKLQVAGLIETGTASDQSLVYIPIKTAQLLIGEGDVVTEVGIKLHDIYDAPVISSDLKGRTTYTVIDWIEQNKDLLDVIETQSKFAVIFYILIFVIAGFGIANTMIMIITRRTKEIGILMAMGARRSSIMKIFLIESVILGPPGAVIGSAMAYLAARLIMLYPIELPSEIYRVSRMTISMRPEFFLYAVAFALAINFFAGLYPSWKASRMNPVEAIASA
jgi:lipoprotein-releasing system permease protein